jgi:hypothetical protein
MLGFQVEVSDRSGTAAEFEIKPEAHDYISDRGRSLFDQPRPSE